MSGELGFAALLGPSPPYSALSFSLRLTGVLPPSVLACEERVGKDMWWFCEIHFSQAPEGLAVCLGQPVRVRTELPLEESPSS